MEGGPDGLRRAFRVFDSDMSGDISYGMPMPHLLPHLLGLAQHFIILGVT